LCCRPYSKILFVNKIFSLFKFQKEETKGCSEGSVDAEAGDSARSSGTRHQAISGIVFGEI
jgi:hypothetical protein